MVHTDFFPGYGSQEPPWNLIGEKNKSGYLEHVYLFGLEKYLDL